MNLNYKIGMVKRITSEKPEKKQVKRPLVKFPKNNTALNEKRIKIIKKPVWRFLIATNTRIQKNEVVSATGNSGRLNVNFGPQIIP